MPAKEPTSITAPPAVEVPPSVIEPINIPEAVVEPVVVPTKVKAPNVPKGLGPPVGPKVSRAPGADQSRLYMNVGEAMGVTSDEVVAAILGTTGLPAATVGRVDLRERHLFVDVAAEHAQRIISQLNRATLKEHKLKVKIA